MTRIDDPVVAVCVDQVHGRLWNGVEKSINLSVIVHADNQLIQPMRDNFLMPKEQFKHDQD